MSLPGAGVESYSYRPDGTGICLRDDVNGVVTGFGLDCASYFPSHKFLKYGDNTTISPDILQNDQWTGNWNNCSGGEGSCWAGYSGGQLPSFNGNVFRWGYGGGAIEQSIALEQVLQATGLIVDGYTYSWRIKNNDAEGGQGGGDDPMYVTVDIYNAQGVLQETYEYDYTGNYDWRLFEGFEVFGGTTNASTLNIRLEGDDIGYWAGYYGPEFDAASSNINMIYRSDPCATNPLFSPECPGYAEAYAQQQYDQNCSADPMYDPGCPGYSQAYETQQCNADPLYSPSCSGYQQAYYDQQCSANPLYDSGCPGYQTAYYDNQCSLDPLYDTGCTGYADAYFTQQCGLDALYDSQCPGYATAYYNQQCGLDSLYDSGCAGYEAAYYDKYIKPELERQAQEAAGTSTEDATTPTTVVDATTTEDPVATLTATPATGDATVDQVLRETADVSTTIELPGMVETTPPAGSNLQTDTSSGSEPETATAAEPSAEAELEAELASLDQGDTNEEEVSESSDNVDESSDEGSDSEGNSESGDGDSGESSKDEKSKDAESEEKLSPEEAKRKKLKEIATKRAMMLAETMGEAATLAQQQAIQAQIAALINFVPGFNAYGQVGIPGGDMYANQPFYEDKKVPENQRGLRNGLAQQLLHEKMVEQQYELGAK